MHAPGEVTNLQTNTAGKRRGPQGPFLRVWGESSPEGTMRLLRHWAGELAKEIGRARQRVRIRITVSAVDGV